MYPKANAPLTWAVYEAANARAERWKRRYDKSQERIKQLEEELKEKNNG